MQRSPAMKRLERENGTKVSFAVSGGGPPLVLVHGGFSDHHTNWELVEPTLCQRFTVYAIARRGRGDTDATEGHTLDDEGGDVATLIDAIAEPVFLLGHSYGAQCALIAARRAPHRVRKLVLYEPPWPTSLPNDRIAQLEALAAADDWDAFAVSFFRDELRVPVAELDAVRSSAAWPPIVADGKATLGDLRALKRYAFDAERYRRLAIPVLLQIGSESPRDLFVTDALAAVLPDVRIEVLPGQAHEGMTTAPEMYTESVTRFLLG